MHKLVYIIFFCFGISFAQAPQDSLTVKVDSTVINRTEFSEKLSDKYSGSDFDYDVMEGEAENLISKSLRWFFQKLEKLFGFHLDPGTYQILEIIMYGIVGIFLLYIVVKLLVGYDAATFFKKNSKMVAPLNIREEHIENIDLDAYIKEALAEKNYRLAIRYMYLKSLKQLSSVNIIEWHYDKTNADYYREITDAKIQDKFQRISYLYDHIWYGEFALDESTFTSAQKDFNELENSVCRAG